jgi:hypothetical protein
MGGPLGWKSWARSSGCIYHMDRTKFAGSRFSSIFWRGMRFVFMDEHGKAGLLYEGKVWKASQEIVRANTRRFGFTESDQKRMLQQGSFKYQPPPSGEVQALTLRVTGPDQEDIDNVTACIWGEAPIGGERIEVNFYRIIGCACTGDWGFGTAFQADSVGIDMLAYFTGGVVLHEIMHNHGFRHPKTANWNPNTDYGASLPAVAGLSVLLASPFGTFFESLDIMRPFCQQKGWRYCKKCNGLFLGDLAAGVCPASGAHDSGGSFNYGVTHDMTIAGQQSNWRWCGKCQGLFLNEISAGVCPATGPHLPRSPSDANWTSWNYSLTHDVTVPRHESQWHWCRKCQGLFLERMGPGACPAGNGHDSRGTWEYSLAFEP